jgi:hypothetical protein
MHAAQIPEAVYLGGQQGRDILPALPVEKRDGALTGADAVERDTAGEAAICQIVMDGTAMAGKMGARRARRFVDGEGRALVEGQRNTAERSAGAAIGGQVGQIRVGQPTVSSNALRNRPES